MDNTTNTLAEQSKLRRLVNSYGVPRLIITGFLLLMFILAPVAGVDFATQITNVINRFSWNAIQRRPGEGKDQGVGHGPHDPLRLRPELRPASGHYLRSAGCDSFH